MKIVLNCLDGKEMKTTTKVDSWAIQDATYDDDTQVLSLHMQESEKAKGETLRYGDVPREVYDELIKANSKGGYFNKHIRNNYPFLG